MVKCNKCNQRAGVCTPVVIIPIKNWPTPMYLQYSGILCQQCANSFTMKNYTDYDGSWYDMACDDLRSVAKPSNNPYPNDPEFNWEAFTIRPGWDPVPKDECYLQFWKSKTLMAKSARQRLGPMRG